MCRRKDEAYFQAGQCQPSPCHVHDCTLVPLLQYRSCRNCSHQYLSFETLLFFGGRCAGRGDIEKVHGVVNAYVELFMAEHRFNQFASLQELMKKK